VSGAKAHLYMAAMAGEMPGGSGDDSSSSKDRCSPGRHPSSTAAAAKPAPLLASPPAPDERGGAYGDKKVANRDTKVWHGATEKGP
jgi:hypothetical protein